MGTHPDPGKPVRPDIRTQARLAPVGEGSIMQHARLVAISLILAGLCAFSVSSASEARDYGWFVRSLVDLDRLPYLEPGVTCAQASSYDRGSRYDPQTDTYINWGANGDRGHYISVDPDSGEALMADLKGPGCICRIWSANPQGSIRLYLDGDTKPTYEFDFMGLFKGEWGAFRVPAPLFWKRDPNTVNSASDCYVPIPYAKSCRVTADQAHSQYYHIGYVTYPPGTPVKTFRLPVTGDEMAAVADVAAMQSRSGQDPQPKTGCKSVVARARLAAGREVTLAELSGPAIIEHLKAALDSDEEQARRKVLLLVYWDEEADPSIWAPLGDFFGVSYGDPVYKSLPMGVTETHHYSYWRMPFRRSARVVVRNEGELPASLKYDIRYRPVESLPPNAAYLHAKWRREIFCDTFDYPFLKCTGAGKFLGAALYIDNVHGGWWGEGDEKVYVDGEKFPSTFGTGSEDYFGDAWGIRHFVNPFHGCPNTVGRRQACYRWHISDNIPFTRSLKITIENYSYNTQVKNDYASMAYWYALPGGADFFTSVPVEDRLVQPDRVEPGALEAERLMKPLPDGATLVRDEALSWAAGVMLTRGAGSRYALPVTVPEAGPYVLALGLGQATRPEQVELLADGKPVSDRVRLAEGTSQLTVHVISGRPVIDFVRVAPWRNFLRNWLVIGPFPNPEDQGLDTVFPPEREFKPDATYKGKGDQDVKWQQATAGADGLLDFAELWADNENAVAYAAATIVSPTAQQLSVLLGSDDGVKVWVNGQLVHANPVRRPLTVDEDRFDIELKAGANRLLVKVEQGAVDWSLCLRVHDPEDTIAYEPAG